MLLVAALVGTLCLSAGFSPAIGASAPGHTVDVVVTAASGRVVAAEAAVVRAGGRVRRQLDIVGGFAATVPAHALAELRAEASVVSVGDDGRLRLLHTVDDYDGSVDAGSGWTTRRVVGARDVWADGITGKGVDVALIDSGIAPVEGMTVPGKVVNGPDLSFESQDDALRHLDTYGHGTHLAGLIAGRDAAAPTDSRITQEHDAFLGIAPDARLVNVKVADATGATDVSQVIAAIDWVVQHRQDAGLNIRVLNLAFGTDGGQPYVSDPLAHAVEVAWRKGIVVVVAAGNDGTALGRLRNPATDPHVIAVGADDPRGTANTSDDVIPAFSSRGDGTRNPDLVAPGRSLASLRVPGSWVDLNRPDGKVNERFFRGSGTSQAAAVTSGAAALLLQQRPTLTPDQVKALLVGTAQPVPNADARAQGAGLLNVARARTAATPAGGQAWQRSNGNGALEASRGSHHLVRDGVELRGEQDIFGVAFDATAWAPAAETETSWSGGTWNGSSWSGSSWSGSSWSGSSWSGSSWSGSSWSGSSWSGSSWSGSSWSGSSWSGSSWSGSSWSGSSWSGSSWSGSSWSGSSWSGSSWSGSSWSGSSWSGSSWSSSTWS